MTLWLFFLCCGLGASVRYFFSKLNPQFSLPLGTLLVNVLGAFLMGWFYQRVQDREVYLILATGFCGGLTTLSTFNEELVHLFENRRKFLTYLLLTYFLGFLAIILGIFL